MKDKIFIDTNILLYLYDLDNEKKRKAKEILKSNYCIVLYSEDMQHGQCIENKLTIVNPFE